MIGKVKNVLENAKYTMLEEYISQYGDLMDEQYFIDEGVIVTRIQRLQKRHQVLEDQKKQLEYEADMQYRHQKLTAILGEQCDIQNKLAYEMSNHFEDLPLAIKLCHDSTFQLALKGLEAYQNQKKVEAIEYFNTYFKQYGRKSYHYLINFTFGKLLLDIGQYEIAGDYLEQALQLKPENIEIYELLQTIYDKQGKREKCQKCMEVMTLLQ